MPFDVIHILLLDGKVLCVELKKMKSQFLIKHLCRYLNIKSEDTFGLIYKDSRGVEQWLDESKLITEHDIVSCGQVIQLIVKIRYIPHHVCQLEANIHQLILAGIRLLRQNWFLAQPDIHSQLVALYLLYRHGINLSDTHIHSILIRCHISMVDPFTKNNYFDTILNAYKIYRHKLNIAADFALKFLHLIMKFPIFNSRLFVIVNSKGEKFLLGVSSIQLTTFYIDRFHDTIKKIDFKNVENVMHRDIKIVISLRDRMRNQRSILDNETITIFALSSHQGDCIVNEINACWNKYKDSTVSVTISQLMEDDIFKKRLNKWLDTEADLHGYRTESITMHLISSDEKDQIINEQDFGELSVYDSDLYNTLSKPDYEQLLLEEDRLKSILYEKYNELRENFKSEKEITGLMPKDYELYIAPGNSKFTRNNTQNYTGRLSHKGCAAEIKHKSQIGADTLSRGRAMSRDNLNYHSSSNIKGSISPSVNVPRMATSHSVTDLRYGNSSIRSSGDNHHSEMKNSGRQRPEYSGQPNTKLSMNISATDGCTKNGYALASRRTIDTHSHLDKHNQLRFKKPINEKL